MSSAKVIQRAMERHFAEFNFDFSISVEQKLLV